MAEDVRKRPTSLVEPDQVIAAVAHGLARLPGVRVRTREPMARHVPLRVGGPADLWVMVADTEALAATLGLVRQHGQSWHLSWPFEDRLVRDGGQRGVIVRPGRGFEGVALLPADDQGPSRLRLGAATPWAALAGALARIPGPARSPLAHVATWPGCPGGLLSSGDPTLLDGLLHALSWYKGRSTERVVVEDGASSPVPSSSAVLLSIELPLSPSRPRPLRRPPPTGTLFADDVPMAAAPQLRAAGLLGTRLHAWRVARAEPGTLVNMGHGDCATALLLAKGLAEHARKSRGVELQLRIPIVGSEPGRR